MSIPQGLFDIDWLNQNSQRRYPLHEDAGLLDVSGTFKIPDEFIVDMIWPVHADSTVDPALFHIAGVGVFGTGVTVALGYNGAVIGSVSIDAGSFSRNQTFIIQGTGAFFDTVGKIVIGSLEAVRKSAGSFSFNVSNGRLEPAVIIPDVRGVSALYIKNGNELSDPFQDDVILQAGKNMLINKIPGFAGEPDRIIFNAIEGVGLNIGCDCDENKELPCIKTINGLGPNNSGDFTLLEDDCLKLDEIANGLQLRDECAQPCCGCAELTVVNDALNFMTQQVVSLENLASRLEAAIQTIEINLLVSKTGQST